MLKELFAGWRGVVIAAWSVALFMWAIGYPPDQKYDLFAAINPERVVALFTVVIAGVGWLTYLIFRRQAEIMGTQARITEAQYLSDHRPDIQILSLETDQEELRGEFDTATARIDVSVCIHFVNAGTSDAVVKEI